MSAYKSANIKRQASADMAFKNSDGELFVADAINKTRRLDLFDCPCECLQVD